VAAFGPAREPRLHSLPFMYSRTARSMCPRPCLRSSKFYLHLDVFCMVVSKIVSGADGLIKFGKSGALAALLSVAEV
jgi:hypothetical protein